MTKEKPILFSGDMIRAILNGRKTQTRRIVKNAYCGATETTHNSTKSVWYWWNEGLVDSFRCPYGEPGHQLWVRETFHTYAKTAEDWILPTTGIYYRADEEQDPTLYKWKPSIHMPRWASRIQLKITDVHIERLQDISEVDAREEGVTVPVGDPTMYDTIYTDYFRVLWDSINEKRGHGWITNPWVWVIDFKRIDI